MCLFALPACKKSDYKFEFEKTDGGYTVTKLAYSYITDVEVPSEHDGLPVVGIGDNAFRQCNGLDSIILPDTIVSIGNNAFENCSRLAAFKIPDGVKSIGEKAFSGCAEITEITMPDTLEKLGDLAFYGCEKVKSVTAPFLGNDIDDAETATLSHLFGDNDTIFERLEKVVLTKAKCISTCAFLNCSKLTEFVIPDSVIRMGNSLFSGCWSLKKLTLPFIGNRLDIPNNFKDVINCKGITDLTLTRATDITYAMLYGCDYLENLILPSTVTNVANLNGYNYPKLKKITIDSDNPYFSSFNGILYNKDGTQIVCVPRGISGNPALSENLTSIDPFQFDNCTNIEKLVIPDKVTSIGNDAFYCCVRLKEIVLPSSLTKIEESTFKDCKMLEKINIPDSVSEIGKYAFSNCTRLENVTVPDSVEEIGCGAFKGCTALNTLTLPFIGENMNATEEKSYLSYLFEALGNYYIPQTLKSVTLTGSKTINSGEFKSCKYLESISIPATVSYIYSGAFNGCASLKNLTVDPDNSTYGSAGNCILSKDGKTLIVGFENSVIPDTVEVIGDNAFYQCSALKSVYIPASVTKISGNFIYDCRYITQITVDENNAALKSENNMILSKDGKTLVLGKFGNELPYGVTKIGDKAFYGHEFTGFFIPDSVEEIGNSAFAHCGNLQSVTGCKGLKSVGDYAFSYCESLQNINLPDSVTKIGRGAFSDCKALTSFTLPKYLMIINYDLFYNCNSLADITIPDTVTRIYLNAFRNTAITSINIPDSVTYISDGAFACCKSLKSFAVGENNTAYKFENNCLLTKDGKTLLVGFKNSVIPDTVKIIAARAFEDCEGLTSIVIPDSVTDIYEYAFMGCYDLTSIVIPDSVKYIYNEAFRLCTKLTNVKFSSSLEYIGNHAFSNSEISSIDLPVTLKYLGYDAFKGGYNHFDINYAGTMDQWKQVQTGEFLGEDWDRNMYDYTVHCTDGDIVKKKNR